MRVNKHSSDIVNHELQFVHFSAKEYLSRSLEIFFPTVDGKSVKGSADNNNLLAQRCLRYLCYEDFKQNSPSTTESYAKKLEKYAFLRYAATQWDVHALRAMPLALDTISMSARLHDPSRSTWRLYSEVVLAQTFKDFTEALSFYGERWPAPLYLASFSGIVETVGYLLDQGADIDSVGGSCATALQRAASRGHVKTFELLLSRGADPSIRGGSYGSALGAAAAATAGPADAAEIMVRMLLSLGVDIEARGDLGWTSLHFASEAGG